MDGPFLADTFSLLPDAAAIARYLITEDDASPFAFAAQARIAYVLQQPALFLHGELCDAYISRATVQGPNRLLWTFLVAGYGEPNPHLTAAAAASARFPIDFLIYVDAAAWQRRAWLDETGPSGYPIQREALIYHELSHLRHLETSEGEPRFDEEGRPLLALTRHSYEFFDSEIRRYGPVTLGLESVGSDFVAGATAEKTRTKRGRLKSA